MSKLPTIFTSLDLQGFDIDQKQQYTSINREMVDIACAVLQKNRVGIVTRSVQAALKHIYGIGGSADTICQLLKEWRTENLVALKLGRGEKDLAQAILEATDDGLLEETDIPEDYLTLMRQMAMAGYKLAYQKADTSVSGDRMKVLTSENDLMKQQLKDFPQTQLELNFYKSEYERQRNELREAYMNLNKQQMADSETFRQQLDGLYQERNELVAELSKANARLTDLADVEARERERHGEISQMNGQLEAREREISSQHEQIQSLQAMAGQKQVIESQLEQARVQLREANDAIVHLQSQQKSASAIQVDVDIEELITKNESLSQEVKTLKEQLAQATQVTQAAQPTQPTQPATTSNKKTNKVAVSSKS